MPDRMRAASSATTTRSGRSSGSGAQLADQPVTGAGMPLRTSSPTGSNAMSKRFPANTRTTSATKICPGLAASQSRLATTTTFP